MQPTLRSPPRLTFFPQDENFWRIDWFGAVDFIDRSRCYRQPSIEICLSKVMLTDDADGIARTHRTSRKQKTVWAPVGWLSNLKVGDIWKKGIKACDNPIAPSEFTNLRIVGSTAHLVKAGISVEDDEFLLPVEAHPWHMKHTQSYCLMVNLTEGKRLVVPCVELIRFYFGSSNALLGRLFMPPLKREDLVKTSYFDQRNRLLRLKLPATMSGYSASDIGRISHSSVAFKAAMQIGISLLQASTKRHKAYPATCFPFTGRTDLTAIGEWLPRGQHTERTFLVHSIQCCTQPFPFDRLCYTMDRPQSVRHIRHGQKHVAPATPSMTHSEVRGQFGELVNSDPSSRLTPGIWFSSHGVKFPDLVNKAVFRIPMPFDLIRTKCLNARRSAPTHAVAVGPSTGTNRPIRPLDADIVAPTLDTENAPEFLRQYLERLATIPGIDLSVMSDSHQDGWTLPINALQEDLRNVHLNLFIGRKGISRVRRACVLSVVVGQRPFGKLVLIEGPPTNGVLLSGMPKPGDDLAYCLKYAALQFASGKRQSMNVVVQELLASALPVNQ